MTDQPPAPLPLWLQWVRYAAKSVVATVTPFLVALGAVLVDGTTLGQLTQAQWLIVILGGLGAGAGVYATSNGPRPGA